MQIIEGLLKTIAWLSQVNFKSLNLHLPEATATLININSSIKLLSKIYKIISNSNQSIVLPFAKWEKDLSIAPNADF